MKIILSYPSWYILLCLIAGGAYAVLLYFRERQLDEVPQWLKYVLAFSRFLVVSILAFLLLEPLIRTENRRIEKPVIVLAQDNSSSLLLSKDSLYYKTEYAEKIKELEAKLSEKFEVRAYSLGGTVEEGLKTDFSQGSTNLGLLFEELYTRYYNRNLGAVILASDGIFNQGTSPVYSARKLKGVPVFTIAMGDTTIRKDLIIGEVFYNRMAYLGNDFPVEITIDAHRAKGETAEVKIYKGNDPVASKSIRIDQDQFSGRVAFKLEARQTGVQRYRIVVQTLSGELTELNNRQDIFVEVLNSKQKILLLANSPHPDLNAIRTSISANRNYEVIAKTAAEFNESVSGYNLIILHQLPSTAQPIRSVLEQSARAEIPLLMVLGNQSNIQAFNELKTGLTISNFRGTSSNASGLFNPGFGLFQVDEKGAKQIVRYPPLQIPFGEWKGSQAIEILFNQRIGSVETGTPLWFFNKESKQKMGVIAGEGIWRWKMAEFAQIGTSDNFDALIQKTIQYLSSRENRSLFRVFARTEYNETDNIIINAELYNKSYELINEPEVEIILSNEEKKDFRFVFSRTGTSYRLDAGKLPAGQYSYHARTEYNGQKHNAHGEFSVIATTMELTRAIADHQMLASLSFQTKGAMVSDKNPGELVDLILNEKDIVEIVYPERRLDDLLHFTLIFFLIMALLTLEWFIRRWAGSY